MRANRKGPALGCAIAASLVLTPIVWLRHLVLLVVPLAEARPRFSAVWSLPVVVWLSLRLGDGDGLEMFPSALVVVARVAVLFTRPLVGGAVFAEARA